MVVASTNKKPVWLVKETRIFNTFVEIMPMQPKIWLLGWIWTAFMPLIAQNTVVQWSTFRPENSGLPDALITDLRKGTGDTLWIGTAAGLAWMVDSIITPVQGTGNFFIKSIRFDSQGSLYLATGGAGLQKRTSIGFQRIGNGPTQLTDDFVNDVAFDADGIWVATETQGLFRFDGVNWFRFDAQTTQNQLPAQKISHLYADGNGNRWLATGNAGLYNFRSVFPLYFFNVDSGFPSNLVTRIIPQGNDLWIGFGDNQRSDNLARFTPATSQVQVWNPANSQGNIFRHVTSILHHSQGKIYVGTNAIDAEGLTMIENGTVTPFPVSQGAEFVSFVNAIAEADTDKVYVGHTIGLSVNRMIQSLSAVSSTQTTEELVLPYPNPCINQLHLTYPEDMVSQWVIVDVRGQWTLQGEGNVADVHSLPPGLWWIRLGAGKRTAWFSIIKKG